MVVDKRERYWVGRRRASPRVRTDNSEPEFPSDLYNEPPPRVDDEDEPRSSGDVQEDELERALEAQYLADGRPGAGPSIHEREQWRRIRREAATRRFSPAEHVNA